MPGLDVKSHRDEIAGCSGWLRAGFIALLLAGCATAPPAPLVVEPEIVRPVVVVERAQVELVATLDLLKAGNLRQAEVNLEEIIKARGDIAEAHFNLGWVRHGLGKYVQAIGHFEDGLRLRPGDAQALNQMALSQREAGRFKEAEGTWRQAIALHPANDRMNLNLGILYEIYLGQPAQALAQYRAYQAKQKATDPKVAAWIALLERQGGKP